MKDNVKEGKERSIIDDLPEPSEKEKSEPGKREVI